MFILPTMRWTDSFGAGWYGAPRGSRTHHGVDLGAYPGMPIISVSEGYISKIGYPYNPDNPKKGHLRYVQVTLGNTDYRYFYVKPSYGIEIGKLVNPGDQIGTAQGLENVYPGITDHIHFEIKVDGEFVNPLDYIIDQYKN